MTLVALGTCMVVAASVQTKWKSSRFLAPLLNLGQHSYEIYLTHMFVVFALFDLFLYLGKPMRLVVPFFLSAIIISAILGALVARLYSEPMNWILRRHTKHKVAQPAGSAEIEVAGVSK